MEKQKVIDWVQKLMTKAMHPNTPKHEVEACERKAAELMARYKISMSKTIQNETSKGEFSGMEREEVGFIIGGRSDWGYYLGLRIAETFDCEMIALKYNQSVCFLGYRDDVDTCKWFFDYLQIEIYLWAEKYSKLVKKQNSYAHGMVAEVGKRLKSLYKRVEEIIPSDCRALVVVKKEKVANYFKSEFPRVRKSRATQKNYDDFSQGMRDGKKLDLSSNKTQIDAA